MKLKGRGVYQRRVPPVLIDNLESSYAKITGRQLLTPIKVERGNSSTTSATGKKFNKNLTFNYFFRSVV